MAQETTIQPNAKLALKLAQLQRQFSLFLTEENKDVITTFIREADKNVFELSSREIKELASLAALAGRSVLDAEYELLGHIIRAVYFVGVARGYDG